MTNYPVNQLPGLSMLLFLCLHVSATLCGTVHCRAFSCGRYAMWKKCRWKGGGLTPVPVPRIIVVLTYSRSRGLQTVTIISFSFPNNTSTSPRISHRLAVWPIVATYRFLPVRINFNQSKAEKMVQTLAWASMSLKLWIIHISTESNTLYI